jgi:hypothetical protein
VLAILVAERDDLQIEALGPELMRAICGRLRRPLSSVRW